MDVAICRFFFPMQSISNWKPQNENEEGNFACYFSHFVFLFTFWNIMREIVRGKLANKWKWKIVDSKILKNIRKKRTRKYGEKAENVKNKNTIKKKRKRESKKPGKTRKKLTIKRKIKNKIKIGK